MNPGDLKEWIESVGGKARIARILQVDESTLWRYENGKEKIPGYMAAFVRMSDRITGYKNLFCDIHHYIDAAQSEHDNFRVETDVIRPRTAKTILDDIEKMIITSNDRKTNDKPIPGRD